MLRIRLSLLGKKGQRSFRVVVIDGKQPRDSQRYKEIVGFYSPQAKKVDLKREEIRKWLELGAQPSQTVKNLLDKHI